MCRFNPSSPASLLQNHRYFLHSSSNQQQSEATEASSVFSYLHTPQSCLNPRCHLPCSEPPCNLTISFHRDAHRHRVFSMLLPFLFCRKHSPPFNPLHSSSFSPYSLRRTSCSHRFLDHPHRKSNNNPVTSNPHSLPPSCFNSPSFKPPIVTYSSVAEPPSLFPSFPFRRNPLTRLLHLPPLRTSIVCLVSHCHLLKLNSSQTTTAAISSKLIIATPLFGFPTVLLFVITFNSVSLRQRLSADSAFEPCGYSTNSVEGPAVSTIHITPEDGFSYASVETAGYGLKAMNLDEMVMRVLAFPTN